MNGIRLKTRYVLTVLAVGLLLTGAVAVTIMLSERHEQRHLQAVLEQSTRLNASDPAGAAEALQRELAELLPHAYTARLPLIIGNQTESAG